MKLNFGSFAQIIHKYIPRLSQYKLVELLLGAAYDEEGKKLYITTIDRATRSKYYRCEVSITEDIKGDYNRNDTYKNVRSHFETDVIPKMEISRLHEVFAEICDLINRDKSIEQNEIPWGLLDKDETDEEKKKKAIIEFLSKTFIYAIQQENKLSLAERHTLKEFIENNAEQHKASSKQGAEISDLIIQFDDTDDLSTTEETLEESLVTEKERYDSPNNLSHRLLKFFNPKQSKKGIAILAAILIVTIVSTVVFPLLGKNTAQPASGNSAVAIEPGFDRHMLIKLDNASHTYQTGLTSWQFYNYPDAEAKFVAARTEISELKSQSEMDVARINNSLGCLYLEIGKYSEANNLLNSAYNAFKDNPDLGIESLDARAALLSLGQSYYLKGDLENALASVEQIISLSDMDTEKSVLATTRSFKAKILESQGKYDEAIQEYQDVLSLYDDIHKDGQWSEELARITNDKRVSDETKDYYRTAQRWVMLTHASIGEVYILMGEYDEALNALNEAYVMCESDKANLGVTRPFAAQIATNIAVALSSKGRLRDAATWVDDKAIRVFRYRNDYENGFPDLVKSYYVFGWILARQGKDTDALEQYNTAISFSESLLGEKHRLTAEAYNAVGQYFFGKADYVGALTSFEKAIEIRRDILALEHPESIKIYLNLALTYDSLSDWEAATDNALAAFRICQKIGLTNGAFDGAQALLKNLHQKQNITVPFDQWVML